MTWKFQNKLMTPDDIPESAIGFIYTITDLRNNRKYLGRKLLTKAGYKMVNKKRKKIRKPSGWEDYWSSSPLLLEEVQAVGTEHFEREVICFADSRSTLSYMEECFQYQMGVLESEDWYNSNIRAKVYRRVIFGKKDVAEFRKLLPATQKKWLPE